MNIFYLNKNPEICAAEHCDKHVVKMIVEYAQLLSTAHRILDGKPFIDKSKNGKAVQRYSLNEPFESHIYKASHVQHPSAIWVRQSHLNYEWLYKLLISCFMEYNKRYHKTHKTELLKEYLLILPRNIPYGIWTEPTPAMPEQYIVSGDSIQSYKNYYLAEKKAFATWKDPAQKPIWFVTV